MGTNLFHQPSPFDILFRNFFDAESDFAPFNQIRFNHPVDIYTTDEGIFIDIACVGLNKKDIELKIEDDILRVAYEKEKEQDESKVYAQRSIARRAFNMGWRISRKFDLTKLTAKLENGLLQLHAPITETSKPKKVTIK